MWKKEYWILLMFIEHTWLLSSYQFLCGWVYLSYTGKDGFQFLYINGRLYKIWSHSVSSTNFVHTIVTYRKNGRFTSSFHCFVQKSFGFLYLKSGSPAISHLWSMCDEMTACKSPFINHVYLISTTHVFFIDLSSTTSMFVIVWVHMITLPSSMIYHVILKV